MPKLKRITTQDGKPYGVRFHCPGCGPEHDHVITTKPYEGGWDWNGDEERPTFSPSVLVYETQCADGTVYSPRCHSYVREGRIEYLSDCMHALAGQTVDLPEWSYVFFGDDQVKP